MYIDSHCHLHLSELAKRQDEVLERMADNQVSHALCVCISLEDFPRALKLAERKSNILTTVGVHPNPQGVEEPTIERFIALSQHPKVVAIGETGLDYYRVKPKQKWQMDRFRIQIRASRICAKPLIIHTRNAPDDTLRILREEGAGLNKGGYGGIIHCFNEDKNFARAALDMGFYISFSGILTYPASKELRKIAAYIPLDRLLIETDSPWLTPQAFRGQTNEPTYVLEVAKQLAAVRGMTIDKIGQITTENYFRLFNLSQETAL